MNMHQLILLKQFNVSQRLCQISDQSNSIIDIGTNYGNLTYPKLFTGDVDQHWSTVAVDQHQPNWKYITMVEEFGALPKPSELSG